MAARVRIQGGSTSPFKVSASNVDADDTFALIFDGNQSPLRILTHGVIATPRAPGNIAPAVFFQAAVGYSAPAGLFPLFALSAFYSTPSAVGAPPGNRAQGPWITINGSGIPRSAGGFGGALANGLFYGVNFDSGTTGTTSYNVNFMIFRNMG